MVVVWVTIKEVWERIVKNGAEMNEKDDTAESAANYLNNPFTRCMNR